MPPHVSIIIPSAYRPNLLRLTLNALTKQTYMNFECILVIKGFNNSYSKIIRDFSKTLDIKVIQQETGYVTTAINMGLSQAKGKIIAFLDDDAIPQMKWLEKHVETYESIDKVGGVAGKVIEAKINKNSIHTINKPKMLKQKLFLLKPADNLKNHLLYLTKGGLIHSYGNQEYLEKILGIKIFPSLLWFGANMSILREALGDYTLNEARMLGLHFEQEIAYLLLKKGYKTLCNLDAVVLHLIHGETTSKFHKSLFKCAQFEAEKQLFYYILKKNLNANLSPMFKLVSSIAVAIRCLLKAKEENPRATLSRLFGVFTGNIMGLLYMLSDGSLESQLKIRESLIKVNSKFI